MEDDRFHSKPKLRLSHGHIDPIARTNINQNRHPSTPLAGSANTRPRVLVDSRINFLKSPPCAEMERPECPHSSTSSFNDCILKNVLPTQAPSASRAQEQEPSSLQAMPKLSRSLEKEPMLGNVKLSRSLGKEPVWRLTNSTRRKKKNIHLYVPSLVGYHGNDRCSRIFRQYTIA